MKTGSSINFSMFRRTRGSSKRKRSASTPVASPISATGRDARSRNNVPADALLANLFSATAAWITAWTNKT